MSRSTVTMMLALDAACDVALYDEQEDGDYLLAVLDEAWEIVGFCPLAWTDTVYGNRREAIERVTVARRGRHRAKLRQRAEGVVAGIEALANAGALDEDELSEARRRRWARRNGIGDDFEGATADRPEDLPVPANVDKRFDCLDGG